MMQNLIADTVPDKSDPLDLTKEEFMAAEAIFEVHFKQNFV
jgi:hypothetical protein